MHTLTSDLEVPESMRSWRCGTESLPEPPSTTKVLRTLAQPRPLSNTVYYASVALETDYEFYANFGSVSGATQYVSDLFAAASAIYQRDVEVVLQGHDLCPLDDGRRPLDGRRLLRRAERVLSYWQTNRTAVPRSTAHMLSMRGLGGGVAYLSQICGGLGYGVSGSLNGSFSTTNPGLDSHILVVTHEIGHNFSSPHTHCYIPPVDMCYAGEGGSGYSGPTSVPRELGTIMSYCHLIGGYAALELLPGRTRGNQPAVLTRIRNFVENSVGVLPRHGAGTVDLHDEPALRPDRRRDTGHDQREATSSAGATVTIGDVAAGVNVAWDGRRRSITATTRGTRRGWWTSLVMNPDFQTGTLPIAYTYSIVVPPPTIGGVTPTFGPTAGGTVVTVAGTNFQSGATVAFGAASVPSTFVNSTTLRRQLPLAALEPSA